MRRAALGGLAILVAGLTTGCASASEREGDPFVAAGFSAERLGQERIAVLPIDAVELPLDLPETASRDSLAASLAAYGADVLATAVVRRGAAGRALGPGVLAPALETVGSAGLARAYEGVLRAPAPRESGGALSDPAVEAYETLAQAVGARYFLVPLELRFTPVEPLRFTADLDVAMVDAGTGRIVWRATVSARNPVAPPGDAPDLYAAALEDATSAVADRAARRLTTVGETDPDEPIEDLP